MLPLHYYFVASKRRVSLTYDDCANEVYAREIALAQISGVTTNGLLSNVVMVKPCTGMLGQRICSSGFLLVLLLVRHGV
jgi:hypothetical protein